MFKAPGGDWRLLAEPRVALMLGLGYSAGLPLLLVFGTLSAWLRKSGVPVTTIGLFSWLALAYSLKFLWSPIVDAFDVPMLSRLFGRRRAWMIASQAFVAASLVGVGLSNPAENIWITAGLAFLVAFGSATQDVVVDGWRIDAAPTSQQGVMAAAYQLGYRLALICAGAGALYIAEYVSWRAAYFTMAALMSVGLLASFLAPIVDKAPGVAGAAVAKRFSFGEAVLAPLADLFRRKGLILVPILLLVALYRLPDFVAGVMANPLYIDLGFTLPEIASISKLYGVWIGMIGAFAGGLVIPRIGLRMTLLIGAIIGAGSNLMFSWLAVVNSSEVAVSLLGRSFDVSWLAMPQHKLGLLTAAISIDNFAGSFAGTALIAYMSGLTGPGFAATQYALLSSLYALPGKIVGGISGFMVVKFGYPTFFAMTAAVGIPVVILCLFLWPYTTETEEEAPAEAANDLQPAAATPAR